MSFDDTGRPGSWPPHDPTRGSGEPPAPGGTPPSGAPSGTPSLPVAPPAPPPAPPAGPPAGWMPPPPPGYAGMPPAPLAPLAPAAPPRWRSLRGLSSALTVLFSVNAVAGAFAVVAIAIRLGVIKDFENGDRTIGVLQRAQDSDDLVRAAAAIYGLIFLTIGVVFIIWMWRAAKNNEALGRVHPRFGPGWSIGAWFIPLANFVIPILIMQDLWRGSDPTVARGDPGWRSGRGSGLVGWWWVAWLLGIVRLFVNSDNADSNHSLSDIKQSNQVALAAFVVHIAAAVLAIFVVRRVSERQEACLQAQQAAWNAANPTR